MLTFVLILLAIFLFWKLLPLILTVAVWVTAFLGTILVLSVHWLRSKILGKE